MSPSFESAQTVRGCLNSPSVNTLLTLVNAASQCDVHSLPLSITEQEEEEVLLRELLIFIDFCSLTTKMPNWFPPRPYRISSGRQGHSREQLWKHHMDAEI